MQARNLIIAIKRASALDRAGKLSYEQACKSSRGLAQLIYTDSQFCLTYSSITPVEIAAVFPQKIFENQQVILVFRNAA